MKIIVLGGLGSIGRVISESLISSPNTVDIADTENLQDGVDIPEGTGLYIKTDLSYRGRVVALLKGYDLAICALPAALGYRCVSAAIQAGVNIVELSSAPEDFSKLNEEAIEKGVTVITDTGFSPPKKISKNDEAYKYVLDKMKSYEVGFNTQYPFIKEKEMSNRTESLRESSGNVVSSDPLTSFLYTLMRDYVPTGNVEKIVREILENELETFYTNGWLAKYAEDLAKQIKTANVTDLQKSLAQAFDDTEVEKKIKAKKKAEEERNRLLVESKVLDNETLTKLEKKLIEVAEGEITKVDKVIGQNTTVDEAKYAVNQLLAQEKITEEEANNLNSDIDSAVGEDGNLPAAEEVKKETNEDNNLTVEEARDTVKFAVRLSESVTGLQDVASGDTTAEKINTDSDQDKLLLEDTVAFTSNGSVVDKKPFKRHVTKLEGNGAEKWKNTNEELKNLREEE